jgi:hypothetical protein
MIAAAKWFRSPSTDQLGAKFLVLLPRLQTHARIHFRDIRCPETRADKIAETIALAWRWYRRLEEKGKDVLRFPMAFAALAVKAVRCGRRVCGQERAKDVLSATAQHRHGFRVEYLPVAPRTAFASLYAQPQGQKLQDTFEERLAHNTQTPVPDQASFRIDWPQFLRSLTERDRRLAEFLALGHSAKKAAATFGLSPGRVTQLRQSWCKQWRRCQEADATRT